MHLLHARIQLLLAHAVQRAAVGAGHSNGQGWQGRKHGQVGASCRPAHTTALCAAGRVGTPAPSSQAPPLGKASPHARHAGEAQGIAGRKVLRDGWWGVWCVGGDPPSGGVGSKWGVSECDGCAASARASRRHCQRPAAACTGWAAPPHDPRPSPAHPPSSAWGAGPPAPPAQRCAAGRPPNTWAAPGSCWRRCGGGRAGEGRAMLVQTRHCRRARWLPPPCSGRPRRPSPPTRIRAARPAPRVLSTLTTHYS